MDDETDFTVGDLRRHLAAYPDDAKLHFDGGLTFGRVKSWGDDEALLLFSEAQADLPDSFRKKNPHIQVAFVSTGSVDWDASGRVGSNDVSIK